MNMSGEPGRFTPVLLPPTFGHFSIIRCQYTYAVAEGFITPSVAGTEAAQLALLTAL